MEFIINNWMTIFLCAIIVANIVFDIVHFRNMPAEQKIEKVKGWLLQAVMLTEKEYGSGTGSLKLSVVYAEFCKQLPWLAKAVTFEMFSRYVDEALERMREILESNKNIAAVVEGGGE